MSYKKIIPCMFLYKGYAIKWFHDTEVISEDPVALAKAYSERGADELLIFDLSKTEEGHQTALDTIRKINRVIRIPVMAGGNIHQKENIRQLFHAGVKRVFLNFSKATGVDLLKEASERFGKERMLVSLNDFDTLFKQKELIEQYASGILFLHRPDLNSVKDTTNMPTMILTDCMEEQEVFRILKTEHIHGFSGMFVNHPDFDFFAFKDRCQREGCSISSFESKLPFAAFVTNADETVPVIVQDSKTAEVIRMAYMNQEAFEHSLKTGKMTYYDPDKKKTWVEGAGDGAFELIHDMEMNEEKNVLLAKVEQRETKNTFTLHLVESEHKSTNPTALFETIYQVLAEEKMYAKEEIYDVVMDRILKKIGENTTDLVIATKNANINEVKSELSKILYHSIELMVERDITWEEVLDELANH